MGDREHWGAGWNGNGEGDRHHTNLTEESSSLSFTSPVFPSTLDAFWIMAQPHPQLATPPPIRAVFDLLDARIRAVDPNVSQEVLNIVPQAKRLRLSLTMPFAELDDPRRIAKNVAGIGRWNDNWRQNREVAHQP